MKTFRLFLLFLLFPLVFHAQQTLTGVWTGNLTNDSTTVRQDQSFEIALTQYKQNVYGYSRRTFIVNDSLYFVVKRMKGKIDGNVCEVIEDEYLSHNFPVKPAKHVKVIYTFRLDDKDSTWSLDGDWHTNEVKNRYYTISGKVAMKQEKDIEKSKIIPHLEELDVAKDIPFYVEAKKAAKAAEEKNIAANTKKPVPVVAKQREPVAKKDENNELQGAMATRQTPKKQDPLVIASARPDKSEAVAINKPQEEKKPASVEPRKIEPPVVVNKPAPAIAESKKPETAAINKPVDEKNPILAETKKTEPPVAVNKPAPAIAESKKTETVAINKPPEEKKPILAEPKKTEPSVVVNKPAPSESKKPEALAINKPVDEKKTPVVENKNPEPRKQDIQPAAVAEIPKKPEAIVGHNIPVIASSAAALVNERKTLPPQEVVFKSDSLLLALYDNGEIDGDTVSVLLNGELILAKQGLKVSAIKKTIYIDPAQNEITLVLYAENLGKYAPNTGLLVVYDGEERYQVRFSADLQQNASVIFRRKK